VKPTRHAMALALASLALVGAPAFAADKNAKADPPGFNQLDKDRDGYLTRAEAAGNPNLLKRFDEADRNKDGRLSRAEYLELMAARDFRALRAELANFIQPGSEDKSKEPKGFNDLDKNGDGKLSRAEAQASPELAPRFEETDDDHDGFVSRAEYLKTMAALDWERARRNLAELIRPDDKGSSSGSSAKK
jgi:Ca2+-binding EF-hand superfamily protein